MEWINGHQSELRLGVFLGFLAVFTLLELLIRRRPMAPHKIQRMANNLGLSVIGAVVSRWAAPLVLVWSFDVSFGLFQQFKSEFAVEVIVTILVLDFVIYWQHRIFHQIGPFWRLHRVHHSDLDLDASSAVRFHPIEYFLSLIVKAAAISVLGCSVAAFTVFEIVLNASSIFNHSNISLGGADRLLRSFLVTPDMHRIHHSDILGEQNSNYGFFLSIWDRLFGSFVEEPTLGQSGMIIGQSPQIREQRLDQLLLQPFVRDVSQNETL